MDVLNLLAIIIIPIAAVIIGQRLQDRAEIRKDKMHIFKVLMTSRIYGWTVDSVHALNLIDVVFAKDKAVRVAWKELYEAYSSTEQSDLMANKRKNLMYKLLEEIANNIGYKKRNHLGNNTKSIYSPGYGRKMARASSISAGI